MLDRLESAKDAIRVRSFAPFNGIFHPHGPVTNAPLQTVVTARNRTALSIAALDEEEASRDRRPFERPLSAPTTVEEKDAARDCAGLKFKFKSFQVAFFTYGKMQSLMSFPPFSYRQCDARQLNSACVVKNSLFIRHFVKTSKHITGLCFSLNRKFKIYGGGSDRHFLTERVSLRPIPRNMMKV